MLLIRAIAAFLMLPALVALAIPVWIGASMGRPMRHLLLAVILLVLGTLLLLWCVREFYISARGTLPWATRRFGAEWHAYAARVPRWVVKYKL